MALTFPALRLLRNHFSGIELICKDAIGRLAIHLGMADAAVAVESAAVAGLFADAPSPFIARRIRSARAVVVFSFSEELAMAFQNAGCQNVHRLPPRPPEGTNLHVARHILCGLAEAGCLTADEGRMAPAGLALNGAPKHPDRIILHPGSGSPKKNWPLDRFIATADDLAAAGLKPVFILGPAEMAMRTTLVASGHTPVAPENLPELADLLQSAGGYLGNDSGTTHLAAWLGVPTVVIFQASDARQWRPVGRNTRVLGYGDKANSERKSKVVETTKQCSTMPLEIMLSDKISPLKALFEKDARETENSSAMVFN